MNGHNITNESLALSMVLVLVAIVVSYREKLALEKERTPASGDGGSSGSDRRRSGDLSIFSRTLYQLSYRASRHKCRDLICERPSL